MPRTFLSIICSFWWAHQDQSHQRHEVKKVKEQISGLGSVIRVLRPVFRRERENNLRILFNGTRRTKLFEKIRKYRNSRKSRKRVFYDLHNIKLSHF